MGSNGRWLTIVMAVGALLGAAACGEAGDPPPAFVITRVGWVEENIDPSVWRTPPPSGQAAFYDFFIHYEGTIAYSDLRSVRVYGPDGGYWNILPDATFLDTGAKVIGGWRRWSGGPTPNLLPIGDLRAEVTLASGQVASVTQRIPAPGRDTPAGYAFMHTEDLASPPMSAAPMVRRVAIAPGAVIDLAARTITLTFSTADPLVHSGWLVVFDAAGEPLGGSIEFRDPISMAITPALGGALHVDGTVNTLTLGLPHLRLDAGATFDQIAQARLVMTDGAQYVTQNRSAYDCLSVGPAATLARR